MVVSHKSGTSLKAYRAFMEAVIQDDGPRARQLASTYHDEIEAQLRDSMKTEEGERDTG